MDNIFKACMKYSDKVNPDERGVRVVSYEAMAQVLKEFDIDPKGEYKC